MALKSQGIKLKRGDGDPVSEAFDLVGSITRFEGPDGEAIVMDSTTLDDTRKRKMMGLPDEGRLVLDFLFDPNNSQHAALINDRNTQVLRNFKLDWNTTPASVDSFAAYVLSITRGGAVDNLVSGKIVLEIDDELTTATT